MRKVFLSYARQEQTIAAALAGAIRARGWDVWFDFQIEAGAYWDEKIERALRTAECVVVLWSKSSVASHWVRTEAEEGRRRNILIPANLDGSEPPLAFRRVQTVDLSGWSAGSPHPGFEELIAAIGRVAGQGSTPELKPSRSARSARARLIAWVLTPLLAAVIVASAMRAPETAIGFDIQTTGLSFTLNRDQEISEALPIENLAITGFERVLIRTAPELESLAVDGRRILRIAPLRAGDREALTVAPISLTAGTRIGIQRLERPFRYRFTIQSKSAAVTVNVQHGIVVTAASGSPRPLEFGSPKAITLLSGDRPLIVDEQLLEPAADALPEPVNIRELALTSIEEREYSQRTSVRVVSNVISGRVTAGTARYSLRHSESLLMERLSGDMERLRLDRDSFSFEFRGRARRVQSCFEDDCTNLTMSYAAWLWNGHRWAFISGMAFYASIVALGIGSRSIYGRGRAPRA